MSQIRTDEILHLNGIKKYNLYAWVEYTMTGTAAINNDSYVSSLVDQGTGNPYFQTTGSFSSLGSLFNECGEYNSGLDYAVQTGGQIIATDQWEVFCGSNTDARNDWLLGYSGMVSN